MPFNKVRSTGFSSRDSATVRLARGGLLALGVVAIGNWLGLWHFCHLIERLPPLCPIRVLTGHACPGCGMGRALALLTHGEIIASVQQHPFALPLLIWIASWALLPERLLLALSRHCPVRSSALSMIAVALLILWWLVTKVA
jgi:hypothetical protein